jgi:P-type conjugative transfer ATPase TrbB
MNSLLAQLTEISNLIDQYPDLSEVMCNPDGLLWIENHGNVLSTGMELDPNRVDAIIRLLAGHYNLVVNREHPALSVKLPVFHGGRFQALVPPIVESPAFSIRFPPHKIFTLDDLLSMTSITSEQYETLSEAVSEKKNILISGGTGSGKTTIANALLNLVTDERLIVIEDSPEIRSSSPNALHMLTNLTFSVRDAVKVSLRMRPDRIIIGEIRDGGTALDLCKAWLTGHPGAIGTIHAGSAEGVYERLYTLMQEVVVQPSRELIKSSINMVVFVEKVFLSQTNVVRRVTKII